ncbi:MAG: hypothetical protein WKG07_37050 [Hymenobacter sp.]
MADQPVTDQPAASARGRATRGGRAARPGGPAHSPARRRGGSLAWSLAWPTRGRPRQCAYRLAGIARARPAPATPCRY